VNPLVCLLLAFQTTHPHSEATLVSSVKTAQPGKSFLAAIHMTMDPTWHTYWVNPGDSGTSLNIDWHLPPGWKAGPILWTTPERLEQYGLVSYCYEREALFLVQLTPPTAAKTGTVELMGKANWLICQRGCMAASELLRLRLRVGNEEPNPLWGSKLAAAQKDLPAPAAGLAYLAAETDKRILLTVQADKPVENAQGIRFYPLDETIEPAAPQPVTNNKRGFTIALKVSDFAPGEITRLRGLLVPPKGSRLGDRAGASVVDIQVTHRGEKR
jgi:thiol:disulfide interchange protein DsbD